MPSKQSYKTLFAVTAGAAGVAGIVYLLYRCKGNKAPDVPDDAQVSNENPASGIHAKERAKEISATDTNLSPVTENEFEIINSQNAESAPSIPTEVENEESEPFVKDNITQRKVLVLGLDRAGKTCLLSAMANEVQPQLYEATPGFNVMCITANGMDLSIWEIGGECKYRDYWENFLKDTSVLVFVVDSTDNGRLNEVKQEISKVLAKEEMDQVPLLVVCTKQDRQTANKLTLDEIGQELDLDSIEDRQVLIRGVEVQCGGAASNKGLQELQDLISDLCSSQKEHQEV